MGFPGQEGSSNRCVCAFPEIQSKRQERKRRSTANPAYSGLLETEVRPCPPSHVPPGTGIRGMTMNEKQTHIRMAGPHSGCTGECGLGAGYEVSWFFTPMIRCGALSRPRGAAPESSPNRGAVSLGPVVRQPRQLSEAERGPQSPVSGTFQTRAVPARGTGPRRACGRVEVLPFSPPQGIGQSRLLS